MLQSLHISHFAIIDELNVDFTTGLNVLTGETGAGKSIIIDAVNLLLGGRASSDLIRTGEDQARVEALFVTEDPQVTADLDEMGIDVEAGEVVIQRVVTRSGRNKVRINGSTATVSMLSQIAPRLIDISGQHEHHSLMDAERHRELADARGAYTKTLEQMREAWQAWKSAREAAEELAAKEADRLHREDYLRFQLEELSAARLESGEYAELRRERDLLAGAEELSEAAQTGHDALYGEDGAVAEVLGSVVERLGSAAAIDTELQPLVETLRSVRIDVEEAGRTLQAYVGRVESDPGRLEEVESRLALIKRLEKKHNCEADDLVELYERLQAELNELSSFEEALETRRRAAAEAEATALKVADKLSKARKKAAGKLAEAVRAHLEDLGMPQVAFEVQVERGELGPFGFDEVEFMLSPNPGEQLRPLARIASGGELSRITLALKCVLTDEHRVSTYVFDEVDSGIGGGIAEVVGRKIASVAALHQVLCITHLPQIAVFADAHFCVAKEVSGGRTRTEVARLSTKKARTEEIARMLGGLEITAQTRAHARQMLQAAV